MRVVHPCIVQKFLLYIMKPFRTHPALFLLVLTRRCSPSFSRRSNPDLVAHVASAKPDNTAAPAPARMPTLSGDAATEQRLILGSEWGPEEGGRGRRGGRGGGTSSSTAIESGSSDPFVIFREESAAPFPGKIQFPGKDGGGGASVTNAAEEEERS